MMNSAFMNGVSLPGNMKRKQTSEQPNPFLDEPINELLRECEKEYTRRHSDNQMKLNMDDNNKS
jgi:hypothetical protein